MIVRSGAKIRAALSFRRSRRFAFNDRPNSVLFIESARLSLLFSSWDWHVDINTK